MSRIKIFAKVMVRNARRILFGIVGLIGILVAIYVFSVACIVVGNALETAMEFIFSVVMAHKWVAILIAAIIGCTCMELLERMRACRKARNTHHRVTTYTANTEELSKRRVK